MKKNLLPVALLLCLFSPAAQAGIFFGASAGESSIEIEQVDLEFDDGDTSYKGFFGFRFFKFFGLELSYIDFGTPADRVLSEDIEIDLWAADGSAMGIVPLGKRFELFAKVGYVYWDGEVTVADGGGVEVTDDDGTDFAYGAGVAFKFGKFFALRGEYEIFDIEDTEDVSLASIGLEIRF
jgi:hypothetical protein